MSDSAMKQTVAGLFIAIALVASTVGTSVAGSPTSATTSVTPQSADIVRVNPHGRNRPIAAGRAVRHPAVPVRHVLELRWIPKVDWQGGSSQRYSANAARTADGSASYSILDRESMRTFHDEAQIAANVRSLVAEAGQPRPGASGSELPAGLAALVNHNSSVYLTADQRAEADALERELQTFDSLISSSAVVLSNSDFEPNAKLQSGGFGRASVLSLSLIPAAATRFGAFTSSHVGEAVVVMVDGRIVSAAKIEEPITGRQLAISGLREAEGTSIAAALDHSPPVTATLAAK